MILLNHSLNHFDKDMKKIYKIKLEDRILNLMVLTFYIMILIKQAYIEVVLI